ncbi:MAG: hypothetical protein ACK502_02580 [Alphaproteobacteria bacterium]
MKKLLLTGLLALTLIASGLYYSFVYPPNVLKKRTDAALESFAESVATKDRAKISESLKVLLTDDAKIQLNVSFFAIIQANANKPIAQDFTKDTFITFIDNVLYPLTDYSYTPTLETFTLADDEQTAAVTFTSKQWADGAALFGGVSVDTRTSADANCEGYVRFTDDTAQLVQATCALSLRTVPKPGQELKLQNSTDAMREYLQK